jgi:hypothetical protein
MTVTSTRDVEFPKLQWGVRKGEERELPEDKKAQEIILAHPEIRKVEKKKTT